MGTADRRAPDVASRSYPSRRKSRSTVGASRGRMIRMRCNLRLQPLQQGWISGARPQYGGGHEIVKTIARCRRGRAPARRSCRAAGRKKSRRPRDRARACCVRITPIESMGEPAGSIDQTPAVFTHFISWSGLGHRPRPGRPGGRTTTHRLNCGGKLLLVTVRMHDDPKSDGEGVGKRGNGRGRQYSSHRPRRSAAQQKVGS